MDINLKLIYFLVFFSVVNLVKSYNVLLVFDMPTKSQFTLGSKLGVGLAKNGINVTLISPFKLDNPPNNYRDITLTTVVSTDSKSLQPKKLPNFIMVIILYFIGQQWTNTFYKDPAIQTLLSSNETFDAVIIQRSITYGTMYLAHHFNAHLIYSFSLGPSRAVTDSVGCPLPPSYVSEIMLGYPTKMNFFQRFHNFVDILFNYALGKFLPSQDRVVRKYFPDAPSLDDLYYNTSLVILNGHESINPAVPTVPNIINIGGYHVTPSKELPKDLKEIMDSSKEGVIFFSLGSIIKSSFVDKNVVRVILKALAKRKEKVLWKWDDENMADKPSNVNILKWFPQNDLLAHPNLKLFISHCGLLSTIESVYHGVPILGLPVQFDQIPNAASAVVNGYAKSIPFSDINKDNFETTLNELLDNPRYRQEAQKRSKIMRDRPMPPIELAAYWIKYVINHQGAKHLRVAGTNQPLYQYFLLDVIAVLCVVLVLCGFLFIKLLKLLIFCLCSKRTKVNKEKKL